MPRYISPAERLRLAQRRSPLGWTYSWTVRHRAAARRLWRHNSLKYRMGSSRMLATPRVALLLAVMLPKSIVCARCGGGPGACYCYRGRWAATPWPA